MSRSGRDTPEWIMMDAWLHRHWEGASREAAQLIELYPTLYDILPTGGMRNTSITPADERANGSAEKAADSATSESITWSHL